jgi:sec-independent protein translocase protein TatC
MSKTKAPEIYDTEQPFMSHLVELRSRLIRCIVSVLLLFGGMAVYANDIYSFVAGPLMRYMPAGSQMIAIGVASPFLTPFKLTLILAVFAAMPYILYQAWAFIAPGLYRHERRLALPLLVASIILFYAGMAFAYFVVFPLIFKFMILSAPPGVTMMTDITQYLDFVLTLFFAFGVSFEVPIATILLIASGMVSRETIADKRPYAIVGAFVIGMVLTPPDVVSQTLLALPIWFLFEIGLLFSRLITPRRSESTDTLPDV